MSRERSEAELGLCPEERRLGSGTYPPFCGGGLVGNAYCAYRLLCPGGGHPSPLVEAEERVKMASTSPVRDVGGRGCGSRGKSRGHCRDREPRQDLDDMDALLYVKIER
jgi:hypothetical protein